MTFAWGFFVGVLVLSIVGFVADAVCGHEPTPYDEAEFERSWL